MSVQTFSIQRKFPELMLNRQLAKSVFVLYDCDCLITLLVLFIPISRYTAYHMFLDYFHGFQSIFRMLVGIFVYLIFLRSALSTE